MRATSLLRELLGLKQTIVTAFVFTALGLVVMVKPSTRVPYCAGCGRTCLRVYDHRERT